MSLTWPEKWSRIKRLTWDEVHTRARQELGKRLDATLLRSSFRPERIDLIDADRSGNFFFSPTGVSEHVRLLRDRLPDQVDAIISEANDICRHRFRLLGYVDLDYGAEIDWHLDVVHGKRSPLKPWPKINFFDFEQIGDHKVIWELNRHQHLVTLAKARLLTGDARYANELLSQWYAWRKANPYPIGINWASSLEVAFRSLSWIWVGQLLAGWPELSSQFKADLVRGLALNGHYIERYLSTYFSPNTHLLGEAAALFFMGVLYPQIPSAYRWKKKGLEILVQEAERQVYPDGLYFEQSLYYHVYALDLFLHVRLLALRNRIDIPANFDEVLKKMLMVVRALSQSGPPLGFGDDDGGRLFNPRRNRGKHMTDPLAVGATFFQDEQLRAAAALTEESIWLFGEQATAFLPDAATVQPRSQSFPIGGLFISAGPENSSQQIVIDAGPLGAMRAGHGHADALSVKYSANGKPCLVDCGTFCYLSSGDERNSYRGTGAHNTLRVDGLDQAVANGPFAWKDLPAVRANSWVTGETFTYFIGSHTGYLRLNDPVLHRRFVFHLYKSFWMVRDTAEGKAAHVLETFWHIDPSLVTHQVNGSFIVANAPDEEPAQDIAFVPVKDNEWDCEITPGHVSPVYGVEEAANVLRCRTQTRLPAEHAMVVRLLAANGDVPGQLARPKAQSVEASGVAIYEYTENSRTHFLVFRDQGARVWNFGDWESDGEFFYYCTESRRISHIAAGAASFIKFHGESLVSAAQNIDRFEYWESEGKRQASSSDQEVLVSFSDVALASWDAGVIR